MCKNMVPLSFLGAAQLPNILYFSVPHLIYHFGKAILLAKCKLRRRCCSLLCKLLTRVGTLQNVSLCFKFFILFYKIFCKAKFGFYLFYFIKFKENPRIV